MSNPLESVAQRRLKGRASHDIEAVRLGKPMGQVKTVYRGPTVAFIPHPHIRGAWVRVHPCVADTECPVCLVGPGQLCLSSQGHTVCHHYKRAWRWGETQ